MTDYLSRETTSLIRAHSSRFNNGGIREGGGGGDGRSSTSKSSDSSDSSSGGSSSTSSTSVKTTPFYINLCYNAPHNPLQASKADYDALGHISNHNERVYAAMIRSLDRGIGEILRTLEEVGMYMRACAYYIVVAGCIQFPSTNVGVGIIIYIGL